MIRALLDTDVILDLVLARAPFVEDAAALWVENEQRRFAAYIAPITPINVFYIVRKIKGAAVAREAVDILVATLHVCTLDQQVLRSACLCQWRTTRMQCRSQLQRAISLMRLSHATSKIMRTPLFRSSPHLIF